MNGSWVVVASTLLLGSATWSSPAAGQFIFVDTDGDGVPTAGDHLRAAGSTNVDIWLATDRDRSAEPVHLPVGSKPLSIISYEFVLAAVGGMVSWGTYSNAQPTMTVPFGRYENDSEIYLGYGGVERLQPGKHKLGTLAVAVKSGNPRLEFRSRSSIYFGGLTSFGSDYPGKDGDHTLKFAQDPTRVGNPIPDEPGDWSDAAGLAPSTASVEPSSSVATTGARPFSVTVSPNPANPEARITIRTTRAGFIRVRIFDLSGRLVRTALLEELAPAGTHTARVSGSVGGRPLASGIYLYRVDTTEATVDGKLIILK